MFETEVLGAAIEPNWLRVRFKRNQPKSGQWKPKKEKMLFYSLLTTLQSPGTAPHPSCLCTNLHQVQGGNWILLEGNHCRTDFWKFNKLILKVQSYLSLASASSTVSASLEIILIQMKIEFLSRLWRIFVQNILNVICLNDRMQ